MQLSRLPKAPARSFSRIWQRSRINPGNIKLKDIGLFLRERIETYFKEVDLPIVMRYFDPSYMIRSSPANAADSVLCDLYARNAAHAAMAGKTGLVIGYLHDSFIHIPIEMLVLRRSTSTSTASGGKPFCQRPDNLCGSTRNPGDRPTPEHIEKRRMLISKQTTIPSLVRVKPGALDRIGIYAERHQFLRVVLFFSQHLDERLMGRLTASLQSRNIQILQQTPVESIGFERTTELFRDSPGNADAIIGFGGGSIGRRQIHRLSLPASLFVAAYVAFE